MNSPESEGASVIELPGQGTGYGSLVVDLGDPNLVGKEDSDTAREVFEVVSKETGVNVVEVSQPESGVDVMDTRIAQALLLAGGFAGGAILARRGVNAKYFRGHSAAGVTAAGLTGAITLRTAARIMKERGDLMHQASIDTPGTVLITDLDDEETLDAICKETGVYPANYNSPHQILLSGLAGAIKVARTRIKAEGARATLFRGWAAGAVHSPIIEVTANMWRSFLDPIVVEDIDAEVVRNIDAKTTSDGDEIKDDLGGMDMPVKWRQGTVTLLGKGVNRFVEIGPRKRPDREHVLRSFLMDQGLEGRVVMEHISDILGLNRQE